MSGLPQAVALIAALALNGLDPWPWPRLTSGSQPGEVTMEYFNAQVDLAYSMIDKAMHQNQTAQVRKEQVQMAVAALKAALVAVP